MQTGRKTGKASCDVPQKGSTFAPDFRKQLKFGVIFYLLTRESFCIACVHMKGLS